MPDLAAEEVVRELRSLLSEELGAVDVYRGSAAAAADPGTAWRLAAIAEQHAAQAAELERQIRRLGGGHAATRRSRAHRRGETPAPGGGESLRERERLGLASYREGLDRVDRVSREAFLGSLIPGQFRNLCAWNDGSADS